MPRQAEGERIWHERRRRDETRWGGTVGGLRRRKRSRRWWRTGAFPFARPKVGAEWQRCNLKNYRSRVRLYTVTPRALDLPSGQIPCKCACSPFGSATMLADVGLHLSSVERTACFWLKLRTGAFNRSASSSSCVLLFFMVFGIMVLWYSWEDFVFNSCDLGGHYCDGNVIIFVNLFFTMYEGFRFWGVRVVRETCAIVQN